MNEQWFGFVLEDVKSGDLKNYLDLLESVPDCMLQSVDSDLLNSINQDLSVFHEFKIGDWVLSCGDCQTSAGVKVYPPFQDFDSAIEYARINLNVTKFIEEPKFEKFN